MLKKISLLVFALLWCMMLFLTSAVAEEDKVDSFIRVINALNCLETGSTWEECQETLANQNLLPDTLGALEEYHVWFTDSVQEEFLYGVSLELQYGDHCSIWIRFTLPNETVNQKTKDVFYWWTESKPTDLTILLENKQFYLESDGDLIIRSASTPETEAILPVNFDYLMDFRIELDVEDPFSWIQVITDPEEVSDFFNN